MLLGLVPCFILIFPSLNFCPLYRAWNTHCSVLRVDSACSLAFLLSLVVILIIDLVILIIEEPWCSRLLLHCHFLHVWPVTVVDVRIFAWFLIFFSVCVLFFSVWHSVYVRIRSWSLVLSWLCFFFDYVFIVGLIFYSSVPLLVPQDGVLIAEVVVLYISKMVSWLTAMIMGLACL